MRLGFRLLVAGLIEAVSMNMGVAIERWTSGTQ
jgi:hypothetical protein